MTPPEDSNIKDLEHDLGLNFKNIELLKQALTHSSFVDKPRNLRDEDNGHMATLGDSVLGLAVAKHLFDNPRGTRVYRTSAKGDLTILRSNFVSNERVEELAKRARLDLYVRISLGQRKNAGITSSMLWTAYEAIIGAIFLDRDYEAAVQFIQKAIIQPRLLNVDAIAIQERKHPST